jgi:hypothetical protein
MTFKFILNHKCRQQFCFFQNYPLSDSETVKSPDDNRTNKDKLSGRVRKKYEPFSLLENEGIIKTSLDKLPTRQPWNHWEDSKLVGVTTYFNCFNTANLTDKGNQYIPKDYLWGDDGEIPVITSHLSFGSITGIVERSGLNLAEVTYTLVRKDITPFGRIIFKLNEETINKVETFTKYDDGWRISK